MILYERVINRKVCLRRLTVDAQSDRVNLMQSSLLNEVSVYSLACRLREELLYVRVITLEVYKSGEAQVGPNDGIRFQSHLIHFGIFLCSLGDQAPGRNCDVKISKKKDRNKGLLARRRDYEIDKSGLQPPELQHLI